MTQPPWGPPSGDPLTPSSSGTPGFNQGEFGQGSFGPASFGPGGRDVYQNPGHQAPGNQNAGYPNAAYPNAAYPNAGGQSAGYQTAAHSDAGGQYPGYPNAGYGRPTWPAAGVAQANLSPYGPPTAMPTGAGYGPFRTRLPQRPRRSPISRLLVGLIGLVLLWVAFNVGVGLVNGLSNNASGDTGNTSQTTNDGTAYQNEDYQVPSADRNPPDLPVPATLTQARQWLTTSPLYGQSVPTPVRCQLDNINLSTASKSALATHLNELVACLMRVWEPPLTSAGFIAVRPSVTIYSGSVTSACGKLPKENAVYCGADQQIYYASDLPSIIPASFQKSRYIVESVIAHEFGHAVQGRSGLLVADEMLQQESTKTASMDLSRRLEQQADCFAGLYLASTAHSTSMSQTDLTNIVKLFYSIGDDQLSGNPSIVGSHGSGTNRANWMQTGLSTSAVGSCNTFTASASSVR